MYKNILSVTKNLVALLCTNKVYCHIAIQNKYTDTQEMLT